MHSTNDLTYEVWSFKIFHLEYIVQVDGEFVNIVWLQPKWSHSNYHIHSHPPPMIILQTWSCSKLSKDMLVPKSQAYHQWTNATEQAKKNAPIPAWGLAIPDNLVIKKSVVRIYLLLEA